MMDIVLAGMWLGILAVGIAACIALRALGVASTYVRDMLHIGAGVWILGWPYWDGAVLPVAIVTCVAIATAMLPLLASRHEIAARIVHSVTNGDEHWTGLVHYTAAYATFTALAMASQPFPAAAALLGLSLGDGIGGAVGRRFGMHRYQMPSAKSKSHEGSFAVFAAATAGAWIAAQLFDVDATTGLVISLGLVASCAEAFAPRGTDNLLIPIAVWTAATLLT
jgi:dolichol kinase